MSETSTAETTKPEATEAKAEASAPEKAPLNVDVLNTCTTRFTRKAWNEFLAIRHDMELVSFNRYAINLQTRSEGGAAAIKSILADNDVPAIKVIAADKLQFISTFEKLQTVIRHPETLMVDLRKA